jgi:2-C-methyl-D-erythritol 4-phosphate cytidylyltransferase
LVFSTKLRFSKCRQNLGEAVKDIAVILPAAGKSTRFGDTFQSKVYVLLNNRAVWLHAADAFLDHPRVSQVIIVVDPEERETFSEKFGGTASMMGIEIVTGGKERWQSVQNGLAKVKPDAKLVAIHDAARPCIAKTWLDAVFEKADETGAAILASPIYGTVKRVGAQKIIEQTVPREGLWQAQTPQVFKRDLICRAYADRRIPNPTDDAELVEKLGVQVSVVEASPLNIKITTKEDLRFAELALKSLPKARPFPF